MESTQGGVMARNNSKSSFIVDVKDKQSLDPISVELKGVMIKRSIQAFSQGGHGVVSYQGRLYIPNVDDLREEILKKSNISWYFIRKEQRDESWFARSLLVEKSEKGYYRIRGYISKLPVSESWASKTKSFLPRH